MYDSGISWVNKDGETGIQVDVESPKQLADAFKKLTSDEALYNTMAKNSRERF
ncbi:glycosyltransferase [Candidatus Acidulodesulfobacterium sp. H_13]|uniref:glycosyltransferase n=1 Tax=Candidatus Acidulodesulfobacterium sp. H_13 TaxID=3395470 RepID=UPI003AF8AEAA